MNNLFTAPGQNADRRAPPARHKGTGQEGALKMDTDSGAARKPDINEWLRESRGETFGSIYDLAMKTASYAAYEKWCAYLRYRYALEVDNPFIQQQREPEQDSGMEENNNE